MTATEAARPAVPTGRSGSSGAAPRLPLNRRPLVLAALTGFAVGSGTLGLLWAMSTVSDGAVEDARAACAALSRMGELPDADSGSAGLLTPEMLARATAAKDLAAAAAAADPTYQPLYDHIDGVRSILVSLNFRALAGARHLQQAEEICART